LKFNNLNEHFTAKLYKLLISSGGLAMDEVACIVHAEIFLMIYINFITGF